MYLLIKAVFLIRIGGYNLRNLTNGNQRPDSIHRKASETDSETPSHTITSNHSTSNYPMPNASTLQRPAIRLQRKDPFASSSSDLSESPTAHHFESSVHQRWSSALPSDEPWDDNAALETDDMALLKQAFRDMVCRRRQCSRAWLRERLDESGVGGLRSPPWSSSFGLRWPF